MVTSSLTFGFSMGSPYLYIGLYLGIVALLWILSPTIPRLDRDGPVLIYRSGTFLRVVNLLGKRLSCVMPKISYVMIGVAIFFSFSVSLSLLLSSIDLLLNPWAEPVLKLVLPGMEIAGERIRFVNWIVPISIVLFVHEASHGITALANRVKLRSAGLILIAVIPGAFVEPEEKELKKRTLKQRLSIYSAGSFGNILLALMLISILPLMYVPKSNGILVNSVVLGSPASGSYESPYVEELFFLGSPEEPFLERGEVITEVNGIKVYSFETFLSVLGELRPGDYLVIKDHLGITKEFVLSRHPNSERAYLGISIVPLGEITPFRMSLEFIAALWVNPLTSYAKVPWWLLDLVKWTIVLNYGIGLINLYPVKPLDGGLMLWDSTEKKFKFLRVLVIVMTLVIIFSHVQHIVRRLLP